MRKRSLSRRLRFLLISVVTVMTIAFLVSTFLIVRREEREFVSREAEARLLGLSGDIEKSLEGYKELSRLIMMQDSLTRFLRSSETDVDAGLINDAKLDILNIMSVSTGIDCVYVFRKDGFFVSTKGNAYEVENGLYSEEEWNLRVLDLKGKPIEYVNGSGALRRLNGQPFITIERAVYDFYTQKLTGYMIMVISESVLESPLALLGDENICLTGLSGAYIAGNEEYLDYYAPVFSSHRITQKIIDYHGKPAILSGMRVGNKPLVMTSITPLEGTFVPEQTAFTLLFLLAVIIVSVIIIGRFVAVNVTRPVYKLAQEMEKSVGTAEDSDEEKELSTISFDMPNNELRTLKDSYNSMIIRIRELIRELLTKEQSVQRAEMRVLQEQIKPHFLYNTISTISALALDDQPEEVSSALETMGRFYRNFLSKGDREITLDKEITIAKDYLKLQKLRYGEILSDEYNVSEGALDCIIPKLILQPLVENSIYHGIRQKGEPGVIRITAFIDDNVLHLSVYDTGVGMDKDKITTLLKGEKNLSGEESSFGLWGTIERVRYFAHRNNVVKIDSEEGEFTKIEFLIPVIKQEKEEKNVPRDDN